MKIHASAPGNVILFGEHVSRHGKPSIVFAVNSRLHVYLEDRDDEKIILNSSDLDIWDEEWPSDALEYVSASIKRFFAATGRKEGFTITTESKIVAGIGTSAATVVATLGALDSFFETKLTKKEILNLGFKVIMDVQGYGSGIDIAAATYGGIVRFVKGEEPTIISKEKLPILVGNTGINVKSGSIVEAVESKKEKFPKLYNPIIEDIGNITDHAIDIIKKKDLQNLGQLMNLNHGLLYAEGVSSLILERLVWAARDAGAYGAKLSGAGVGDNMIALVSEDKAYEIEKAINNAGGKVLNLEIDPEGLLVEEEI